MENLVKRILEKNKINFKQIKRSMSGFSNIVYFVDDKYFVKLCNEESRVLKLQKEIEFYKHLNLTFVPKYIASGIEGDFNYLIIEKVNGVSLYKVWHELDENERENVIKQIAEILRQFHEQGYSFLAEKFVLTNWILKWQKSFEINVKELQKRGFDTSYVKKFAQIKLPEIMAEQKLGLVHNDAHFDNFIYDNGKIKLIDFDRVLYCSIDYEFLIIKSMVDRPEKFASEEDEENAKKEDYEKFLPTLKKYYPEMFDFEFLDKRVFVYQFIYNLGNAYKFGETEVIKEELEKFKRYFGEI